jgi:NAD(P)-dependent dehydrogenase (short-subunit alcohol dehydrogenase family)
MDPIWGLVGGRVLFLNRLVVALVSGAARSNGRAIALALARRQPVAVLDAPQSYESLEYPVATTSDLEQVATDITSAGGQALAVPADVRDADSVNRAVEWVRSEAGAITDLVVCSGVVSAVPVARMSRTDWDEVVDTNLTGSFHLIRAVVPQMAAAGDGRVVLVTGPEGRRGFASLSHVAAAAWALIGMAKTVALEVAASGVRVNVICAAPGASPPLTALPEYQAAMGATAPAADDPPWEQIAAAYPQGRPFVAPEEVAAAVEFLLSDATRSWTGAVLDVSLGVAARNSA